MTDLVDASIAALRTNHDQLADLVATASGEDLSRPSGATEWTVADVLSHLGSGSELFQVRLQAAIDGVPVGEVDNQAVWDRWNAMSPEDQATAFVKSEEALVAALESLDDDQRRELSVDLGFMPAPAPLAQFVGMRLVEVANHAWDARAGLDAEAAIEPTAAVAALESLAGELSFMLGFSTKPDELPEPAVVALDGYALRVGDGVSIVKGSVDDATATFAGPLESVVRLLSGRLRPERTPSTVEVTGNVSLEDLRKVFPGY
jgi:uncharacterized protein (TIGR03083 family)